MRLEFRLPDIGEGLESAEIVEWLVQPGQRVLADDTVCVVETDKATVDMPSPAAGVLVEQGGGPGDVIHVGDVLAIFEVTDRAATEDGNANETGGVDGAPTRAFDAAHEPPVPAAATAPSNSGRAKAAPAVRRLATELEVDLQSVAGSGANGRVTRTDVLAAASLASEPATPTVAASTAAETSGSPAMSPDTGGPRADERIEVRGLRRQIAERMAEAWRTIPHMADFREVDATGLIQARETLRASSGEVGAAVTFVPIVVKAVATALQRHRHLNASIDMEREEIMLHGSVNIGIATAIEGGLLVPVVHDADRKSVLEIAAEVAELATLARERRLSPAQMARGTFTVNNLGGIGGTRALPIIRPPEVCIMAFGRITKRAVVVDDEIVVRPMLDLSTVADHRIVDGSDVSAFLTSVGGYLEAPMRLLGELR